MRVTRNQLAAMYGWLETTESADDATAAEVWNALQSGKARANVSENAVREALYYADNKACGLNWTRADERAAAQLHRRLYGWDGS